MARLVSAMAMTHSPGLTGWFDRAPEHHQVEARRALGEMRERLAAARPDVIVLFTNDHLLNWPINNTPEYTVGIGADHEGPADWYDEWLALAKYRIPGHPALARYIVNEGARRRPRDRRPLPRAGRSALLLGGRGLRRLVPRPPEKGRPCHAPARVHARAHGGGGLGRHGGAARVDPGARLHGGTGRGARLHARHRLAIGDRHGGVEPPRDIAGCRTTRQAAFDY